MTSRNPRATSSGVPDTGTASMTRPLAVDAVQTGEHPFAGPRGVVVDHQIDPLADGELRRVFALLAEFAPDGLHRFDETRRGRGSRAEEGIADAAPRGPEP